MNTTLYNHYGPIRDYPGGSAVKKLLAMQETQVRFLGQEDSLEKGMAICSGILAWELPQTKQPDVATVHGVAKSWKQLNVHT